MIDHGIVKFIEKHPFHYFRVEKENGKLSDFGGAVIKAEASYDMISPAKEPKAIVTFAWSRCSDKDRFNFARGSKEVGNHIRHHIREHLSSVIVTNGIDRQEFFDMLTRKLSDITKLQLVHVLRNQKKLPKKETN